jgi:hypothetical protein
MASSDWIEVQRLAAEFQRAQLSSALQKYKLLKFNPFLTYQMFPFYFVLLSDVQQLRNNVKLFVLKLQAF